MSLGYLLAGCLHNIFKLLYTCGECIQVRETALQGAGNRSQDLSRRSLPKESTLKLLLGSVTAELANVIEIYFLGPRGR